MRRRGFTLIEVLVALAIISLVLVALLRLEVSSISTAATNGIAFRALTVATKELDDCVQNNFSGDMEKNVEPFQVKAHTEQTSQNGIPIEKLNLEVLYADKRYSELTSFKIKL
jgi:prepilin-type N-terminal cleavage/methylation domain-containing protein